MGEHLRCRWYEKQYPDVDEMVMVNVKKIADMGAYVRLVEYNDIEAMILLSELSRRRIRSINKLIRIGKNEPVVVLRVDREKGYIDLSKRRVVADDLPAFEEKFSKGKAVHSIMRHVAEKCQCKSLEDLYIRVGWPLAKKYGHAYDAFRLIVADNANHALLDEYDITPEEKAELIDNITRRLTPKDMRARADIEVTCFDYAGVEAVKQALKAGYKAMDEDSKLKIRLIAPPVFVLTTVSSEKQAAIDELNKAIGAIKQAITELKGNMAVVMEPRIVQDTDDRALDRLMAEMESMNREVSGDEETGSEGEEEGKEKE